MATPDGAGTMRMAHPSFIAGRRTAWRLILDPTLARHTGFHDLLIPDSVLSLHNFAPVHAGAASATFAGKARHCFWRSRRVPPECQIAIPASIAAKLVGHREARWCRRASDSISATSPSGLVLHWQGDASPGA
jgi:hypothetical protein